MAGVHTGEPDDMYINGVEVQPSPYWSEWNASSSYTEPTIEDEYEGDFYDTPMPDETSGQPTQQAMADYEQMSRFPRSVGATFSTEQEVVVVTAGSEEVIEVCSTPDIQPIELPRTRQAGPDLSVFSYTKNTRQNVIMGTSFQPPRPPPVLQDRYKKLVPEYRWQAAAYVQGKLADGSNDNYYYIWRLYNRFLEAKHLPTYATAPQIYIDFIYTCDFEGRGVSTIKRLRPAIKFREKMLNLPTCWNTDVDSIYEGLRARAQRHRGPVKKQTHMSVDVMDKLIRKYMWDKRQDPQTISLNEFRVVLTCILQFQHFQRVSDILKLRAFDFELHEEGDTDYITVHYRYRKNDQIGDGPVKPLIRDPHGPCPVTMVKIYYHRCGLIIHRQGDKFLDTNFVIQGAERFNRHGVIVQISKGKSIKSQTIISELNRMVVRLGIRTVYGAISMKSGGVTAAFDAGLSNEEVQQLGNWKTEEMPRYYRRESINHKLALAGKQRQALQLRREV